MTGPGSLQQAARVYASLDAAPPADHWEALGEAIEQHGRDIDAYAEQVRAERIQRRAEMALKYGEDGRG